jgi:predicted nucleotidyltransferase component of viral defense system
MIPRPVLTAWRNRAPWRDDRQVAQDLILSLAAIRAAGHPSLRDRLVWRGGTCLHKVHLERARRYSEDLDYVLVGDAEHSEVRTGLEEVVTGLGMEVSRSEVSPTRVNVWGEVEVPTVGALVRLKFEVNCADLSPVFALTRISHSVNTRVWKEQADLLTFLPSELLGTKFRALAQRRKGRDLSDLWLARRELRIVDGQLARAADYYLSAASVSPAVFRKRLAQHSQDPEFSSDLNALTTLPYEGFDTKVASRELIQWADRYLDPLVNQRRSASAVRRDQAKWKEEGQWAPGKIRCPEYPVVDGNLSRCPHWYFEAEGCPDHG